MNQTPKDSTPRINRALYVITVTMLFVIAVVIAITSASSRTRKPGIDTSDSISDTVQSDTPPESTANSDSSRETKPIPPETSRIPQTQAVTPDTETPLPVIEPVPMFKLPVNGILSKKHDTSTQVYSATMNDYRVHCGIDIVTSDKASVYASADGTVSKIWEDPLMGYCLSIEHSGDSVSIYKNLSEEVASGIEEGAKIAEGQLLGTVGGTAMIEIAEEPHLHFEMTVSGKAVDPLEYFDETALVSLTIDSGYES